MKLDQSGSATVELVLITPAFLALLLLVVAGGRLTDARERLDSTARDVARAASQARSAAAARVAVDRIVAATRGPGSCGHPSVVLDTSDLRPGGTVTATLTCRVDLSSVSGIGLPGSKTLTARATEPVDRYARSAP